LDKHRATILEPKERNDFEQAKFKVDMCKMLSNCIMITAVFKLFTLKGADNHHKRLTMLRLLLLNGATLGMEIYFMKPVMNLRKDYEKKYLEPLTDQQLDQVLSQGWIGGQQQQMAQAILAQPMPI